MTRRGGLVLVVAIVGGSVLVGAVAFQSPTFQAYAYLAGTRAFYEIEQLVNPLELFDEPGSEGPLTLTHGVASGEVTATSAVIWARANQAAEMHVEYAPHPPLPPEGGGEGGGRFGAPRRAPVAQAQARADYTARALLEGLQPSTTYFYRVWMEDSGVEAARSRSPVASGRFQTAPAVHAPTHTLPPKGGGEGGGVAFVFGGDLGGAGYCREADRGYPIFEAMRALGPRFFVALGDMIYADEACPGAGPGGRRNVPGGFRPVLRPKGDWTDAREIREIYARHWRYNRADRHLQGFLQDVPLYAVWDDHEVINDSGGAWPHWIRGTEGWVGYPNLVRAGRDAFFDYAPMIRNAAEPDRIYRSFRWGPDLELFLLDLRSYRSRNDLPDRPEVDKRMLGPQQLAWLKWAVQGSSATWKVIGSSVPLSAPTGGLGAPTFGYDGWADGADSRTPTGFERELLDLLRSFDEHHIRNVVFIVGDLHRPLAIRYELDLDGDGKPLRFYELVAGPLSASPRDVALPQLDPTLNPQLLYSDGGFFNFGYARLARLDDGATHLIVDIRGEDGQPRPGSTVDLAPQR